MTKLYARPFPRRYRESIRDSGEQLRRSEKPTNVPVGGKAPLERHRQTV